MVDRDSNGRFIKGRKGHTGPRKKKADPGLITLMTTAMPNSKRIKIIRKAVEQAIEGDKFAREWLFNYVYGKAPDTIDMYVSGGMTLDLWLDNAKRRMEQAEEVICGD